MRHPKPGQTDLSVPKGVKIYVPTLKVISYSHLFGDTG